ncbi:MAG TPA: TolC family protein [Pseudomonadota bacterium]|nr:TolC family protein [Pseudomonadota bacterium]HNN51812.1 TolC family protein [Pseudomonadota bacterium]
MNIHRLCVGAVFGLGLCSVTAGRAQEKPPDAMRIVTLRQAIEMARKHQPQLLQARAQSEAARARIDQARAPILPQLVGTASYQRTTANFVARPGAVPAQFANMAAATSLDTFNYFNFGLQLSQYIWDFGQTTRKWQAAKTSAEAQSATEKVTLLQITAAVHSAYFAARAQKALLKVAADNLANQQRHLVQVQAFVQVGTRPEIDLAQARTDRANASVQVIASENNYAVAKAQLNQAMGIEADVDYDVQDEPFVAIPSEEESTQVLLAEALKHRPEFVALSRQIEAQKLTLAATKGAYGPSLNATMNLTDAGTDITQLSWNWNAAVNLNWPIFQGLLTHSQVREQHANLSGLEAQLATLRQQVRVDIESSRLQVRAGKAAWQASEEALKNASERLRLAEARYRTGIGSIIELGDAQVAMTTAAAQRVSAEYQLASARVLLLRALGLTATE